MKVLVYLERGGVRGGIEVFADRHVAELRAAGHDVEVAGTPDCLAADLNRFDEIVVHKCPDVAVLELSLIHI